jgi:hypothetical protein
MVTSFLDAAASIFKAVDIVNGEENVEVDLMLARGSATRFLSQFIIEPQIKISTSLKGHEHIQKLVTAEVDMFSSIIRTAFNVMLEVYGADAKFAIQILASKDMFADKISAESDGYSLGKPSKDVVRANNFLNNGIKGLNIDAERDTLDKEKPITKVFREAILTANLEGDNGKSREIKIRVLISASVQYVEPSSIYNLVEVEGDTNSLSSRWDDKKAGVISTFNFFVPLDIIKQYKEDRLKDKDDLLLAVNKRKMVSVSKLAQKQALGFARFYQCINTNSYERERIEKLVRGNMSKKRYKERVLEFTKSMIFASMDDNYEMADIFIHDLEDEMSIPYKDLKKSDKNDTSEILKFLANRQY